MQVLLVLLVWWSPPFGRARPRPGKAWLGKATSWEGRRGRPARPTRQTRPARPRCDRARHTCIGEEMRRSHQQGPRKLTRSTTRRTCVDLLHCGLGLTFVLVIVGIPVSLVLSVVLALLVLLVLCVWLVWSVVVALLVRSSHLPLINARVPLPCHT